MQKEFIEIKQLYRNKEQYTDTFSYFQYAVSQNLFSVFFHNLPV